LEFIEPLVAEMMQDYAAKRPNMDEIVAKFEVIRSGLSDSQLRSRVGEAGENRHGVVGYLRSVAAWGRRNKFVINGVPAIPTPEC
jgi:hypothetical protein